MCAYARDPPCKIEGLRNSRSTHPATPPELPLSRASTIAPVARSGIATPTIERTATERPNATRGNVVAYTATCVKPRERDSPIGTPPARCACLAIGNSRNWHDSLFCWSEVQNIPFVNLLDASRVERINPNIQSIHQLTLSVSLSPGKVVP